MDKKEYLDRVREEKYKSFEKILSKIVHDMKNLLSGMIGYSRLISTGTREEQTREDAEKILEAGLNSLAFMNDIGEFYRKPALKLEKVELEKLLIESIERFAEHQGLEPEQIALSGPDHAVTVEADRAQLRKVLMILLKNCVEAAERLSTRPRIEILLRKEGPAAVIEIEDNGPGVEEPHLIQIFDPFFSTHPDDQVRGHGLSRAYNTLRHMGGGLDVYNTGGKGAAARIKLPLTRA